MIANRNSIDRNSIDSSRSRSVFSVKSHSTFYSNGTKLSSTYSIPSTRKQQITHNVYDNAHIDNELAIPNSETYYNTQSNRNNNNLKLSSTASFDRHHIKANSTATLIKMGNNYDNSNTTILPCFKTTIKQVQPTDFVVINDLPYPVKIQFPAKISERESKKNDKNISYNNNTPSKHNKYNNDPNNNYNNVPNERNSNNFSQNLSTLLESPRKAKVELKMDRNDTSEFEISILDGYDLNAITSTPKTSPMKKPTNCRSIAFEDDLDVYDCLSSIYEHYMKL